VRGAAVKRGEDKPVKTFGKPAGKPTGRLEGAKPARPARPGAKPAIAGPRKPTTGAPHRGK
jgi:hypothetical protein